MPAELPSLQPESKGPAMYNSGPRVTITTPRSGSLEEREGLSLQMNVPYFLEYSGLFKLLQLAIGVIVLILISPPLTWFSRLFTFVAAYSFAITLLLIFAYLVSLHNVVLPNVNWIFVELIFTVFTTFFYLIMSIVHLCLTNREDYEPFITNYGFYGTYVAAGALGLVTGLLYGGGSYFLYRDWKMDRSHTSSVSPSR